MRNQTRVKLLVVALVLFVFQTALMPSAARAADSRQLKRKVEALEAANRELREANRALEEKSRAIEDRLQQQTEEVNRLKQEVEGTAEPVLRQHTEKLKALEKKQAEIRPVSLQVGFLTGWSESPYDMPGGFFWGAYLRDGLLTEEDGVPGGDISGELMAGIVMGTHAPATGNVLTAFPGANSRGWLNTIEIQPTAQYHLHMGALGLRSWENFKPYVLAGPAIWVTQMNIVNPLRVKGQVPAERYRNYSADTQAGGVYGVGFQYTLAGLNVPYIQGILDRTSVGAEWRYNELANGEQFQQYMGSIALGL